jgi:lipopolysaccharide transport system ATP-binding protein
MIVRLAFSTATAVRPDILIVDEALAVGDAYFQHKCFNRIRKFRELGTSLLFVSHDPIAVKNLCDKAILLDQGIMIRQGSPDEVLDYYNAIIAKREADEEIRQSLGLNNKISIRSGNKDIVIENVELYSNGSIVNAIQVGDSLDIQITLRSNKEVKNPTVGFIIKDRLGNDIYGTNTYHLSENLGIFYPGEEKVLTFHVSANIGIGTYSITVAVHDGYEHLEKNYDWIEQAATFQVIAGKQPAFVGVSCLSTSVTLMTGGKVHVGS